MMKDPNLKLTDEQKNQLKSINEQRRQHIQAIQQDGSLTREQKLQKIREVNQGTNQQIRNTLTPEQYQRWQRRQRDRREDVRDRREDRRDQREDRRDRKEDRRDKRRKP
jgi:predicted transglutaminase-like cysteine proteinase